MLISIPDTDGWEACKGMQYKYKKKFSKNQIVEQISLWKKSSANLLDINHFYNR